MSTNVTYMALGDLSVSIVGLTPDVERHMEMCARICYNSLDKAKEGSHKGFLRGAIRNGHFSILSHAHCTFIIQGISRSCSHQLVRHAHQRYLQRSQRYCSEKNPEYVAPDSVDDSVETSVIYHDFMETSWKTYGRLVDKGIKKEDARFVLPNACQTKLAMSGTLQGWWDFLRLRMGKHAQWEIKQIAQMIYSLLNAWVPSVFTPELLIIQPKLNLEIPDVD